MVSFPDDKRILVEKLIEDKNIVQEFRPYLGISSIGEECERKLWYSFRLSKRIKITAREHRLFNRGHREEPIIIEDLKKVGIIHHSDQKECVCCNGHMKGHCDGILENVPDGPKTPHLSEFKTSNDKSFQQLKKTKDIMVVKPVHYAQMITYQKLFKLKRGLYVAVNKNNDERYYERIKSNNRYANILIKKGERIIFSDLPPLRKWPKTYFKCKNSWCKYSDICHYNEEPLKTCRTCKYIIVSDKGRWGCSKKKKYISWKKQQIGCKSYQLINLFHS